MKLILKARTGLVAKKVSVRGKRGVHQQTIYVRAGEKQKTDRKPLFEASDTSVKGKVEGGIKVPYVDARISTLGGAESASIMIRLSLDKKEDWSNGIIHNSRFNVFSIDRDGTIEHGMHTRTKKFIKRKTKTLDDAISKINAHLQKEQNNG